MEPTPSVGVNTPPAAFGTNLAEATEHLGGVTEAAGKELFDRAYAMQDLQVHADVNARLASMQNDMMNHYVDFSQLEGKNAVDGLGGYQSKLDEIRTKSGDGLSPIGQSYYDTESRNARYRLGLYGALHAAGEQKKYIVGSVDAGIASSMKMMELDPDNPAANDATIQKIRDDVAHKYADIGGMSPEEVTQKQNDTVNQAVQGQVRSLAKSNPIGAQKLLDDAIGKKEVYGEEASRLGDYVKWQRDLYGSRVSAGKVLNEGAGFALDSRKLPPDQILTALRASEGGSYTFRGPTVTDKAGNTGQPLGHYGVMSYNLQSWLRQSGLGPMSEDEFLNSRSAQDQLAAWKFGQYQDKYGSAKAAAKAWFGGEGSLNVSDDKLRDKNMSFTQYFHNFSGGVARGSSLADLSSAASTYADSQFKGDDDFKDAVVQRTIALHNQELAIRRDTDFNNQQAVASALVEGVGPQHKIPTTVDELRLDPKASAAWDDLSMNHPTELRSFLNQMAQNAKGDVAMTPERLNAWQKLYGEAIQDPQKFMTGTQDLSTLDLPRVQKMEIIRMRGAINKKQDAAPQMGHALTLLGHIGVLSAAGLTKEQDPDNLALFTGVLHNAMEQYQRDNGKSMDDETIKTTAGQLLSNVSAGRSFFHPFGQTKPWFESLDSVPDEAAKAISAEFNARGIMPSEQAILQAYLAAQYQEIYGKKVTPPNAGAK